MRFIVKFYCIGHPFPRIRERKTRVQAARLANVLLMEPDVLSVEVIDREE
jgi:hypothetical protein